MKRTLSVLMAAAVCAIGAGCVGDGSARTDDPPAQEDPAMEQLSGTLKSGFAGIGGEHTGWALMVGKGVGAASVKQIEVDVSRVREAAKAADGKPVKVSGGYVEKRYVERGVTKIFVIERIE
jgi:hypothetical protein